MTENSRAAVTGGIRDENLATIAMELVNIQSSIKERQAAEYVAERFAELGMEPEFQEVEEDRWNVLLRLRGNGGGKTLLFSGHLDTSMLTDDPQQIGSHVVEATRDGDWLYGLGMSNMKNAFAAYYEAIRSIQDAGVSLDGDILVAAVVGETERAAPAPGLAGARYRGAGIGSTFLAAHGLCADFAIIGEPTALHLAIGQTGIIFARITVTGTAQHTWCKEYGVDPIEKMQAVMDALRAWEPELKRLYPHPLMDTRLGIGAIRGGLPYKPSRCPAPDCTAYIDLRIPPPFRSVDVRREIEAVLQELRSRDPDLEANVDFYLTRTGYEIGRDEPVVTAMERAHQEVFAEPVAMAIPSRYCVSSDGAPYWDVGIPAITYGAGGIQPQGQLAVYGSRGEAVSLTNLRRCAQVYALAAMDLCGTSGSDR